MSDNIKKAIGSYLKLIYPQAKPVVITEEITCGKFKCSVYLNEMSVPTHPIFFSNLKKKELDAEKHLLSIIKEQLECLAMDAEARHLGFKMRMEMEIKRCQMDIKNSERHCGIYAAAVKEIENLED